MCQKVSCFPWKHLYPSCLQAFLSFLVEGMSPAFTHFILHLWLFLT